MTLSFLAGRSTIRRLHQTVHRNLNRRHRQESTKSGSNNNITNATTPPPSSQKPSPHNSTTDNAQHTAEVFSGSYWAWIEPIKIPFRAYSSMQQRSPLTTQLESSLIIYFLGDLSAQTVQTNVFTDGRYEPIRGLRAMIIGGISSIPSYKWFLWLGRHFNYASHVKSLAAKIVVSQMCFTPIFNTYFFGMQTLLSGGGLEAAKERVVKTVPVSWANSWKLWPMVTAFLFTFVRAQNRNVVAGVVAIGWQTYLSWLNRAAEREGEVVKGVRVGKREMQRAAEKAVKRVEGKS